MSEYMEKHSVAKLIGSPPGYIGYDEGGRLTSLVRLKPYSVVLFDEIEKAHSDIYNILLQILEEGTLTDSHGRSVDFKNTIIILTSNIGAKNITEPKKLGFSEKISKELEYEGIKAKINDALKAEFNPEFLNRLDEIITFNKLSIDNIKSICKSMLKELDEKATRIGMKLDIKPEAVDYIAERSYDKIYGARPLRRTIMNLIETPLSKKILTNELPKGASVSIDVSSSKNELEFSLK